ncbi:hypothetical protein PG996_014816 [Apiospora saccharicola]|uniref:Uncharacterized protein n=1 Tax=Apiospora saccharicola TaxID=335842 RepID=A0ABR1TJG8_9PEZI
MAAPSPLRLPKSSDDWAETRFEFGRLPGTALVSRPAKNQSMVTVWLGPCGFPSHHAAAAAAALAASRIKYRDLTVIGTTYDRSRGAFHSIAFRNAKLTMQGRKQYA